MSTISILTPSRAEPTPEYRYALAHNSPPHSLLSIVGQPIDVARNELVRQALALDPRPDYCVWIDDDAFWLPQTIERLVADLKQTPKPSMIVPWCGRRGRTEHSYAARFVNDDVRDKMRRAGTVSDADRVLEPIHRRGQFMTAPEIHRADFVSQHFAVHHVSLLKKLEADPFSIPADGRLEEDLQFHDRIRAAGLKIYCDATLPVWHVGTGLVDGGAMESVGYLPGERPCRVVNGRPLRINSAIETIPGDDERNYGTAVDSMRKKNANLALVNA